MWAVFLAFESIEHLENQQSKDRSKSGGKTESEYNLRIELKGFEVHELSPPKEYGCRADGNQDLRFSVFELN